MATRNRLLGVLLDNARLRKGYSVAQVSREAKVPLSVVQKILGGHAQRPSWWVIRAIARTLEVPLSQLSEMVENSEGQFEAAELALIGV